MWLIIIGLFISFILTIIGMVSVWNNKNPKLAWDIVYRRRFDGGNSYLTSNSFTLPESFVFTKKPPVTHEPPFADEKYDGTMRPLISEKHFPPNGGKRFLL